MDADEAPLFRALAGDGSALPMRPGGDHTAGALPEDRKSALTSLLFYPPSTPRSVQPLNLRDPAGMDRSKVCDPQTKEYGAATPSIVLAKIELAMVGTRIATARVRAEARMSPARIARLALRRVPPRLRGRSPCAESNWPT